MASGDPTAYRLKDAAGTCGDGARHHVLGDIKRLGKEKNLELATKCAALVSALTEEILNAPPDPFGVPFAEATA